jgi:predicted permease
MTNLKNALRQIVARPGLATIVVITLALGIGVNAAMFSLFHQLLLEPLPVPEAERLVNLRSTGPKMGSVSCTRMGVCDYVFSYPMLRDLEREQTVFTGIAAHRVFEAGFTGDGAPAVRGRGMLVNDAYFRVLQLAPALGRLIGPQDEPEVGESAVVVLSYDYWLNAFGADPDVLGRTLTVNGQPMNIIGVAPEGFSGASLGEQSQVFVPLTMRWKMQPFVPASAGNRQAYWVYLFARLKPGVSIEQAEQAINGPYRAIISDVEAPAYSGMSPQFLDQFRQSSLTLETGARGQSHRPELVRLPLALLLGVTGLVLLIACVNIANLLLVRGSARTGEFAVRAALGAGRTRLIGQLLGEAGILGVLGCLASLAVAAATLQFIAALLPAEVGVVPRFSSAALLFAIATSLATVLLFGLFPALAATGASPVAVLKEQGGYSSGSRTVARFRVGLATAQIAFSMVLLALAGLFSQSLANASRVELGLTADSVATFSIAPVLSGYPPERTAQVFRGIEENLAALPGVVSVTTSMVPVVAGDSWGGNVSVQGFDAEPDEDVNAQYNEIGSAFFTTLQIPLLAGRDISAADSEGRPRVALVNEAFARKFELGADAVGKRMAVGAGGELDIEIIGLVRDAKYSDVKEEVPPQYFLSRYQNPELGSINFYVRSNLAPESLLPAIPRVVADIDPDLPVDNLATLPGVIRDSLFIDRLIGILSSGFALLATLLAAIGLYGVLSYAITQRTRELGLRQALGATPGQLRGMVLRQVGLMGLVGATIGLVLAILLGRAAEAVLFGLTGYDPFVLGAAALVLAAVVLVAGYLPARHASGTDPLVALRHE